MIEEIVNPWPLVSRTVEAHFDEVDSSLGEVFRNVRVVAGGGNLIDNLDLQPVVKGRVKLGQFQGDDDLLVESKYVVLAFPLTTRDVQKIGRLCPSRKDRIEQQYTAVL